MSERAAIIAGLLGVAALAWSWRATLAMDEAQQSSGAGINLDNITEEVGAIADTTMPNNDNRAAFLAAIRACEGTAGPQGYRTMFGGALFDSYDDHPRRAVQFTDRAGRRLWTSAAGAYQFMAVSPLPSGGSTRVDTWDRLRRKMGLMDFSPANQDRAAPALVDECGALADVDAGRLSVAVDKCRRVWASLPGAGYAQGERSPQFVAQAFTQAGGVLA